MHVYKRENSRFWWCRFEVHRRQVRRSTGQTCKREALAFAARLQADMVAEGAKALGSLAQCEELDIRRCEQVGTVAELPTMRTRWARLKRILGESTKCHHITDEMLDRYVVKRRRDGVAAGTIKRELRLLMRGLKLAKRKGWLVVMPMLPEVGRHVQGVAKTGREHPMDVLLSWIDAMPPCEARDKAVVALGTGLRKGELHRLCPDWLHEGAPGEWCLRVPAAAAKGRVPRTIPVSGYVLDVVRRLCGDGKRDRTKSVFSANDQNHRACWHGARARIGYETIISFRDLRTTFISVAARTTGDPASVQAVVGHKNLVMTNRYMHSTVATRRRAAHAVASQIGASSSLALLPPGGVDDAQASEASAQAEAPLAEVHA